MTRVLRCYLLGCLAFTFAYLIWHAHEPLRLNIGDPWSDAELVSSVTRGEATSTSSALVYRGIAALGVTEVGTFRWFALAFSAVGTWALFQFLRRAWSDSVALLGTTIFTTSLLSITHADGLQSPPLAHAACFVALWGLIRAIETEQLRYHAATVLGSFVCMFASSDNWLFLAAGTLWTLVSKRGDPLARRNFRFVAVVVAGGIAGFVARSHAIVDRTDWLSALDNRYGSPVVPLLTIAFSPMIWVMLAGGVWRMLRLPSLRSAVDESMSWLVVVAFLLVSVSSPRPGPPMLRVVAILPFFAVGSAIAIDRLLRTGPLRRTLALLWTLVATVWAFGIMFGHQRAVLDRQDVASARAYLAGHDGNDFVISNLLSDGVVHAAFDRWSWSPIAENDDATAEQARIRLLEAFEAAGTDYIHAVIFTNTNSRFNDRSLGQLTRYRGLPPGTDWPYVRRGRADELIEAYDAEVREALDAIGARRVLHFDDFDVYRIDRPSVLERSGQSIPVVRTIDFHSPASNRFELLGWEGPRLAKTGIGVSSIVGYASCANPHLHAGAGEPVRSDCETAPSPSGLHVPEARLVNRSQLLIRVDRSCDLRMTFDVEPDMSLAWFGSVMSPVLEISVGDFTALQCASSRRASFVVPRRFLRDGINLVTFATRPLGPLRPRADLRALELVPSCEP